MRYVMTRALLASGLLCWASTVGASPAYPLEISSNQRYFVDQANVPVLVHGEAAWSLIGELTREEAAQYLDDCAARNFNSLIVTLVEKRYVSNPPNNAYGDAPFLTPGKFSTPNDAYFQHADWVIQQAAARGIQILLAPVYMGVSNNEGWYVEVRDYNTEQDMRDFGAWVGNRYKNTPNLMFVWGDDIWNPEFSVVQAKIRAMGQGLRSVDGAHLVTFHAWPEGSSIEAWDFTRESWLDFNAVYTYEPVWQRCQSDYTYVPTVPSVLFESKYENEYNTTGGKQQRVQAYQALLSGMAGHFYGNSPIWHMGVRGGDWVAALSDPGRASMVHVRDLFESRAWYRLVPDTTQSVLTSGLSTGDDRATAALTDDGATLIVYAPSQRTLRVNLDQLSGTNATAWWFNPRDGSVDAGTPVTSSGSWDFTPPTNDDWVLVIDDAASMLPAPGTAALVPDGGGGTGGGGTGGTGQAGTGGTVYIGPIFWGCSTSTQGGSAATLWFFGALGAWVLIERRRLHRQSA